MAVLMRSQAERNLERVIEDCYNHENWDTNDRHNFESMATLLEYTLQFLHHNTVDVDTGPE